MQLLQLLCPNPFPLHGVLSRLIIVYKISQGRFQPCWMPVPLHHPKPSSCTGVPAPAPYDVAMGNSLGAVLSLVYVVQTKFARVSSQSFEESHSRARLPEATSTTTTTYIAPSRRGEFDRSCRKPIKKSVTMLLRGVFGPASVGRFQSGNFAVADLRDQARTNELYDAAKQKTRIARKARTRKKRANLVARCKHALLVREEGDRSQ